MYNDEMELARQAILAWMRDRESRNRDDDYEMNEEKADKMNAVIACCQEFAKIYADCVSIVRCNLTPGDINGEITLFFIGNDLPIGEKPDSIRLFKEMVEASDGVNLEPFGDESLRITFFVTDLYRKK